MTVSRVQVLALIEASISTGQPQHLSGWTIEYRPTGLSPICATSPDRRANLAHSDQALAAEWFANMINRQAESLEEAA